MAKNDSTKYYWLKLEKDFFKKAETRVIESMANGKDYILFYLKLLCESTSHEGNLRLSETIPYNEEMLATITNTNVDIVRSAIKVFTELKLMSILDDGTIYMEEVQKMIGCETGSAQRKREERLKNNLLLGTNGDKQGNCPLEIELEKDIEIDKEIELDTKGNNVKESQPTIQPEIDPETGERLPF